MKLIQRISFASATALLIISSLLLPMSVRATGANLIANPSFATNTPTSATNWSQDSWGSNQATFDITTAGYDTTPSAHVTVQNYVDGDAKWIPDPIVMAANHAYTYSDASLSTVTTNIWAVYISTTNVRSYQWLGSVPASSQWQVKSFGFTTPADVASASIMHVLNANGSLNVDTASVTDNQPCPKTMFDGVVNGSFELSCVSAGSPDFWSHYTYGTVGANFALPSGGTDGATSASFTVTSAGGGEAGWSSDLQPIAASSRYELRFDIKASIYSYVYLELHNTDNSVSYVSLSSLPATGSEWSQYYDSFVTPSNASTFKIFIATSDVGTVQFDAVRLHTLSSTYKQLTKGAVSITFDDGLANTYQNALPYMTQYKYNGTWYINGDTLGTSGFMTTAQVKALLTKTQEVGSHSYDHFDLVQQTTANRDYQLQTNNILLKALLGQNITQMATPFGSYNNDVLSRVTALGMNHRDTSGQLNYSYNFYPEKIHGVLVTSTTSLATLKGLYQLAAQNKAWLVLVYHGVGTDSDSYTVTKANFQKQVAALASYNVDVQNVSTISAKLK